jgi:4-hydroxy-tetrahydrodipicolinate synthase
MFSGALTAMISPFNSGKLDEGRLRANIEFQIQAGIDGLVPVGTTGESPTLDFREHERVIELTVQVAKGRVPVIAGVGGNATDEALRLHQYARDVGADAGLSVNPYYNKPTQEGLYHHFMWLADRVKLPIVLYNIPGRSSVNMSPATVARLARHDNIVAIKEAAGSLDQVSEIRTLCDLPILSGDDSLTLPMMSIGAAGVISVASNVIPRQIKQMVTLAREGCFDQAAEVHHRLFPFIKALFLDGNPAGIKHAMKIAGFDTGELRLPLWEASPATQKQLAEQMRKLDIPLKSS